MGARTLRISLAALLALVLGVTVSENAYASMYPVGNGTVNSACVTGTNHGSARGDLTNGVLYAQDCYLSGKLTTVALSYAKSQGSAVTATFAWSFSNSSGTSFLNGDVGTRFSISAGQAKHQIFYYTGLTIPSGYPCVRGELWVGATTYVTKIIC